MKLECYFDEMIDMMVDINIKLDSIRILDKTGGFLL